jgi:steroid delta-isomerase-like uncharacterized protein
MSVEENKALMHRFFDITNANVGNFSKMRAEIDALYAPGFVQHHTVTGDVSFNQYMQVYQALFTAFPDANYIIDDMIAEGDKVVLRLTMTGTHKGAFQGIPPTGKQVKVTGVGIYRIAGGKFIENWSFVDMLGLMQQLGIIPQMGQK